jgi:hypothetical protein
VTQEISQLPKFWADKYGGSGVMVNPSAHPQHINGLKHLICMDWMWEPLYVGLGPHPMSTRKEIGNKTCIIWPKLEKIYKIVMI